MAKVTLSKTIIGTPDEMAQYGGQLPANVKKFEKKMSAEEKAMYAGKLYAGTEMEVDEKRAKELADAGLVEGSTRKETPGEKILVRDTPREKKEGSPVSQKNAVTAAPKAAAKASTKAATKSGKKSR